MRDEDRQVVADLFAAIAARDTVAALELVHPDVVWRPTSWSSTLTLRGRDSVKGWFEQFGPAFEHLRIEVAEILGASGWIVVLGTIYDTRDEGSFATRVGWNFAVEDRMICEARSYSTWSDAREAGGAPDVDPGAMTGPRPG
jgi:ketosteroid isomerase-like protein